jgi:hypothetical protein
MNKAINEFFTRPQRQTYYSFDLGPSVFYISNVKFTRQDFLLKNI